MSQLKRISMTISLLLIGAVTVACGGTAVMEHPAEEQPVTETTVTAQEITESDVPVPTIAETATETESADTLSGYAELLDWYYHQITTGWSDYDKEEVTYGVNTQRVINQDQHEVSYLWYFFEKPDITKTGYQLLDINHDGVDELVVGVLADGENDIVYDVYTTLEQGNLYRAASAGERVEICVGNGVIRESGSSGAMSYGTTYYKLTDGIPEPVEAYDFDAEEDQDNPYYYTNEFELGEWGGYVSKKRKHITEEEFLQCGNYEIYDLHLQPFSGYTPAHTIETSAISEEQLKTAVMSYGNIGIWQYADYDGNGEKEAFAVITSNADGMDSHIEGVYFVDSSGKVTPMRSDYHMSYYQSNDGYYRECQGKGFFWCDYGAFGSGWQTMLYSVRDGIPYELDVASSLQGFYQEGERFFTTKNDFTDGHSYPQVELVYEPDSQQFRMQSN